MYRKFAVMAVVALGVASVPMMSAADTEQDIVNRYLKKAEAKHITRISWISANFTFNRINRNNDYNRFANYTSEHFSNTSIPWLGDGKSFGIDLGVVFRERLSWSVGGEYWLKLGINRNGSFDYNPPGGTPTVVTNLVSEVRVFGVSSSIQCYLYNPPTAQELLNGPAVRIIGSVGYYQASWDVWNEYQNLNLATSAPTADNTTFKGSAPGISFGVGIDYPLRMANLALGLDFSYMHLNFNNVAWYNSLNQEIIATYDDSPEGRVDLSLSGFRGKVEIKRFFKW
ncbi:MAG: hypothetical protein ACE5K8_01760 [Candidatus Zixiibacteriota bacterium]